MTFEFKLPDVGEGIHEAEVLAVKVKEGDQVKEYQPIFDIETDKAVVEITSPVAGTVEKILVSVGDMAKVGDVLITFATSAAGRLEVAQSRETQSSSERTTRAPVGAAAAATTSTTGNGRNHVVEAIQQSSQTPVPAAPATRRLARELGVDLKVVRGSGPGGRVLKEDIRAFAEGTPSGSKASQPSQHPSYVPVHRHGRPPAHRTEEQPEPLAREPLLVSPAELPDFSKFGPVERVPLRSLRRKIAMNMTQSWTHVPHVAHFDQIDITDLEKYRLKHEKTVTQQGGKLTLTVFVLKAIISGLRKYPIFNSSLDEATSEIVYKHYFNIGVAVATDRGLIVPVIKDVDKKSVVELSRELAEVAQRTREGKVELDKLQGGTFTITNIGAIGGTGMMPMVNYPEVAIFGMARAKEQPVVRDGHIVIRNILNVALSFDHRVADGADAARFVRHICDCLEDPFRVLLEV